MPTNVTAEYQVAEIEFFNAKTSSEKLKALKKMLAEVPKHKGTENLQKDIKEKIKKIKELQEKEKKAVKKGHSLSVKKEGAAQIVIIGLPNSGKSTLLTELTNAAPYIADYPFTTYKPEMGMMMTYEGVGLQVVELPAITKKFHETENGPAYLGIIKMADVAILIYEKEKDKQIVMKELYKANVKTKVLFFVKGGDLNLLKKRIWNSLGLIYAFTKQPGKPKEYPPVALKKGSTVGDFAKKIHKDFFKKFRFARINGPSAKFPNQRVGLEHILKSGDVVELHSE